MLPIGLGKGWCLKLIGWAWQVWLSLWIITQGMYRLFVRAVWLILFDSVANWLNNMVPALLLKSSFTQIFSWITCHILLSPPLLRNRLDIIWNITRSALNLQMKRNDPCTLFPLSSHFSLSPFFFSHWQCILRTIVNELPFHGCNINFHPFPPFSVIQIHDTACHFYT